jgi:hypothetical protein
MPVSTASPISTAEMLLHDSAARAVPTRSTPAPVGSLFVAHNDAAGSPRTRPVPFTGLLHAPQRIEWRNAPASSYYTLDLSAEDFHVHLRSQSPTFDLSPGFQFQPGMPVTWRIACFPVGPDGSESAKAVEGILWTMADRDRTRLTAARGQLKHGDDEEMKWIATGLSCAECGLFDEAIRILEGVGVLAETAGRRALASRALVAVYEDMEEKLPESANCSIRRWIRSRRQAQASILERYLGRCADPRADRAPRLVRSRVQHPDAVTNTAQHNPRQ